jgi:hypothetical protein
MQMTFTNSYYGAPILFESWAPKSSREFAGSFLAITLAAFCFRALIYSRAYLNSEYWSKATGVCPLYVSADVDTCGETTLSVLS